MSTANLTAGSLNPPTGLSVSVTGTATLLNTISLTENNVLNTNVQGNSKVPNLLQHVQNARNCANTWNNTVKPLIAASMVDITGYGDSFNTLYTSLSTSATAIQANPNDAAAIAIFQAGITTLLTNSGNIYNQSVKVQNALVTFQATNSSVSLDFQSDFNQVKGDLQADQDQMSNLEQQMGSLQNQLEQAEEEREELQNPWVVIATLGLSEVISLIQNLQGSIQNMENVMQTYQGDMEQDEQDMGSLTSVAGTLSNLLSMTTTLQKMMITFITSWQSISDNLTELQDMANISPTDGWALSDLQAVNSEWEVILAEVVTT